ncbi:MAG: hypothetical protein LBP79_07810 [Clostridiales bacterium]|nr:hypothetical protein [Clostridiales bacterium]
MRGGLCGEADTVETVTEGLITANDARFFLINDWRVMVENCRCIPEEMSGKECFIGFIAKPYILLAVGLSVDGEEIVETFFDSSFTSTIAADLGM